MDEAGTRWIDTLADLARERLPEPVGTTSPPGSGDGVSAAEAVAAWRRVRFSPHVLRDVTAVDTSVRAAGHALRPAVRDRPTTLQRAAAPEGEVEMARAATVAGVPTWSRATPGPPFAEIAATGPWWLQVYVTADRADTLPDARGPPRTPAQRAVVLTADTPVVGTQVRRGRRRRLGPASDLSWHRGNFAGRRRATPRA